MDRSQLLSAAARYRTPIVLVLGVVVVAVLVWRLLPTREPGVTIGMEGSYRVVLRGDRLEAVPYTHGDALAVRIASAVETKQGTRYDLRYMAYGPGEHDIARYLVDRQGRRPSDLPEMVVSIDALLADDESGELFGSPESPVDLNSNYYGMMALLWGLWVVLLIPLLAYGRKPRAAAERRPPPPSVPQRLRALLETAQRRSLDAEQQADLEKLLLHYWSKRLDVPAGNLVDTLERLRQHPTAGPQVRRVERWLHARDAASDGGVAHEILNELGWSGDAARGRPAA
ncbi:MAG: hypothetical protein RIC55_23985 [Pirellulaceae bacterium]